MTSRPRKCEGEKALRDAAEKLACSFPRMELITTIWNQHYIIRACLWCEKIFSKVESLFLDQHSLPSNPAEAQSARRSKTSCHRPLRVAKSLLEPGLEGVPEFLGR